MTRFDVDDDDDDDETKTFRARIYAHAATKCSRRFEERERESLVNSLGRSNSLGTDTASDFPESFL